jgi:hypothetical protein
MQHLMPRSLHERGRHRPHTSMCVHLMHAGAGLSLGALRIRCIYRRCPATTVASGARIGRFGVIPPRREASRLPFLHGMHVLSPPGDHSCIWRKSLWAERRFDPLSD